LADLPPETAVREAVRSLVGRQDQRPPQYSAKKVSGDRAFAMARRGAVVDLEPVGVEVFAFEVTEIDGDRVLFKVEVSSGTYIRALARDLGANLGCGAHLETLRRTRVGAFDVSGSVSLDAFADAPAVLPALGAVGHMQQRAVDPTERDLIVHGRPILANADVTDPTALVYDGALLGIAEAAGELLKPRVVLADE
jgi:tRNA pseudouridine55 synthase